MPAYSMACCRFPLNWCRDVDRMARKFLWLWRTKEGRFLSPIAWKKVCSSTQCEGLEIKCFEDMNLALLCKLGWALAAEDKKLWTQAVKAKYFPNTNFLKCNKKILDSWYWKGILSTKPIINKGFFWCVWQGDSIDYWEDPWIPLNHLFLPTLKSPS